VAQAIIRLGIGHAMLWNWSCCGTGHVMSYRPYSGTGHNTFWYKPCYVLAQAVLCCGTGHIVAHAMLWTSAKYKTHILKVNLFF
jgi:hypothetical protein